MIKTKFGQRLRSRTLTAQINEALCKVLCHNPCVVIQSVHELGIEAEFATAPEIKGEQPFFSLSSRSFVINLRAYLPYNRP